MERRAQLIIYKRSEVKVSNAWIHFRESGKMIAYLTSEKGAKHMLSVLEFKQQKSLE